MSPPDARVAGGLNWPVDSSGDRRIVLVLDPSYAGETTLHVGVLVATNGPHAELSTAQARSVAVALLERADLLDPLYTPRQVPPGELPTLADLPVRHTVASLHDAALLLMANHDDQAVEPYREDLLEVHDALRAVLDHIARPTDHEHGGPTDGR